MTETTTATKQSFLEKLNGPWHERALWVYLDHRDRPLDRAPLPGRPDLAPRDAAPAGAGCARLRVPLAGQVRGDAFHLRAADVPRPGPAPTRFHGTAKTWWTASLVIQTWHLFEHSLLQLQAIAGQNLFGSPVPTSILQQLSPGRSSTCSTTWPCSSRWSSRCGCTPVPTRRP